MLGNIFIKLLEIAVKILKWPFIIAAIFTFVLFLCWFAWYLYLRFYEGIEQRENNGDHYRFKDKNIFMKVALALKQMALDKLTADPATFRPRDGRIIAMCGRQGQGKTIAIARLLMTYQTEWPHLKVATNFWYKYGDNRINHWRDLIKLENDNRGYVMAIDEAQQWFNSRDYKNFDINMLQEITTQRKQSKMIVLSTQSFHFLDKNIRCQVQEIHQCYRIGSAFTLVIVKEPVMTYDGEVEKLKFRRMYCFEHSEQLRNCYDTYEIIQTLEQKGFVPRSEQLGNLSNSKENVNITIDGKKKK